MLTNEEIQSKIADLELFLVHAEEICQIAKRDTNLKISAIRKECPHTVTTYVPDASGNNDSFNYCTVCGLDKKRF